MHLATDKCHQLDDKVMLRRHFMAWASEVEHVIQFQEYHRTEVSDSIKVKLRY